MKYFPQFKTAMALIITQGSSHSRKAISRKQIIRNVSEINHSKISNAYRHCFYFKSGILTIPLTSQLCKNYIRNSLFSSGLPLDFG